MKIPKLDIPMSIGELYDARTNLGFAGTNAIKTVDGKIPTFWEPSDEFKQSLRNTTYFIDQHDDVYVKAEIAFRIMMFEIKGSAVFDKDERETYDVE